METNTPTEVARYSGGESPAREAIIRLRSMILQESDVLAVLGLCEQADGRWLYLIKTPFATWPKFVVGYTDDQNLNPSIIFRCGLEDNGVAKFQELNTGAHA